MASRKIEDLHPDMQARVRKWLERLATETRVAVLITCTYRSPEEQMALYAQGRYSLNGVNEMRAAVGLPPITEEENKRIVTKLKRGKHQERLALDFVVLNGRSAVWDIKADVDRNGVPDYREAGKIAQECGLVWGGDWDSDGSSDDEKFLDMPHIQMG